MAGHVYKMIPAKHNKTAHIYEIFCIFNASHKNFKQAYRKVCNISRTLVNNKIVDHSDVVGASPVGAAPTTSSFST